VGVPQQDLELAQLQRLQFRRRQPLRALELVQYGDHRGA
jgi:hypothetical protein